MIFRGNALTKTGQLCFSDQTLPLIERLGIQDYKPLWRRMREFTEQRNSESRDQLWIVEHRPVYTLGLNGKSHHILNAGSIPVVQVDRGGQVTYHGPGQLVIYLLLDLKRMGIGVRSLVRLIENSIISTLDKYQLTARTRDGAPGVYLDEKKIAALGLRIKKGCCYHGLSLNLKMDLEPFSRINPCGYEGLEVTQLNDHVTNFSPLEVQELLLENLMTQLDIFRLPADRQDNHPVKS